MRFIFIIIVTIFLYADRDDYCLEVHLSKDLSFLELNSTQQKSIREILKEHRDRLKRLHEREEEFEHQLKDIFKKDRFYRELFFQKNMELKAEIVEIETSFFEKIHSILNRKQRERFIEHIEEWEVE